MNKTLYKIIFNKKRGQMVVVAENALREGKSNGDTRAGFIDGEIHGLSTEVQLISSQLRTVSFSLMLCLGTAVILSSPIADARVVADPNAPGTQRPTILPSANGTPQVNIQKPTKGGVSMNQYKQFDVDKKGVILNNSRKNTQTQLGGMVQANPWLAGGEAKVIVNQVNSRNPSQLNGYVEVAGQKADVIIANQAGLSINGGGFINTHRAILTTGTPIIKDGLVAGYSVQGGSVNVHGEGLDVRDANYTRILTAAANLNGGVWGQNIDVVAGHYDLDANDQISTTTASPSAPAFAIDTGALGGMYAGKITLVSTDQGRGIQHQGQLFATAGGVSLTADGKLHNSGVINSNGTTDNVTIKANSVHNSGTVSSQHNQIIQTQDLTNTGLLASAQELSVQATDIVNDKGTFSAGRLDVVAEQLHNVEGAFVQTGTQSLLVEAGALNNHNQGMIGLTPEATGPSGPGEGNGGDPNEPPGTKPMPGVDGPSVPPSTGQGGGQVNVAPTQPVRLAPGQIKISDTLDNTGRITGNGGVSLEAKEGLSNRATLNLNQLTVSGAALDNQSGTINTQDLMVNTQQILNQQGVLTAANKINLVTQHLNNQSGQILASASLSIDSEGLNNQKGTLYGAHVVLDGNGQLINNQAGAILSAGRLQLNGGPLNNQEGQISASTDAVLNTQKNALNNTQGVITSAGELAISSGVLTNQQGLIQSNQGLAIDTNGQTLDNRQTQTSGGLVSQGAVSLRSGDLYNQNGALATQAGLTVQAATINNQNGLVQMGQDLTIQAVVLNNQKGQIQTGGAAQISLDEELDNREGWLIANDAVGLEAKTINNSQTQSDKQGIEAKTVDVQAQILNNQSGSLRADELIQLTLTQSLNNHQGLVSSGKVIAIGSEEDQAAPTMDNGLGKMIAGEQLQVGVQSLNNEGGELLSLGDADLHIHGDHTEAGLIQVQNNANLTVAGRLINKTLIQAGGKLVLAANHLDNQATAEISAGQNHLNIDQTLTNRGLIDGGETYINANKVHNLGEQARIYGDHVAIQANALVNDVEQGQAATIAARERLDLGVQTLVNREHGLIFSGGDMAIGGQLDANHQATGTAQSINNNSATIEALGNIDINTALLRNTNEHFATEFVEVGREHIVEYEAQGQDVRYKEGTQAELGWSIVNDESDQLKTPDGKWHEDWHKYDYWQITEETHVVETDPSKIIAGGHLTITGGELYNQDSQIVAGGKLTTNVSKLNNEETLGKRVISANGCFSGPDCLSLEALTELRIQEAKDKREADKAEALKHAKTKEERAEIEKKYAWGPFTSALMKKNIKRDFEKSKDASGLHYYWRSKQKGTDTTGHKREDYKPAPEVMDGLHLGSFAFEEYTKPIGSGLDVAAKNEVALNDQTNAASKNDVVEVGRANDDQNVVIRTQKPNTKLPNNSLFTVNPNGGQYLVETDPRFTNNKQWLGSDYMLGALGLDPNNMHKRLGDGFYEQRLLKEQIVQLTGQTNLPGYDSEEAQYKALMSNGVTAAKALGLAPGVALSAEQVARLTSDIVWLVTETVTLPNGQTTQVLVPQLYVQVQPGDIDGQGALLGGNTTELKVADTLRNSGTIAGREAMQINAHTVDNLGGRISADNLKVTAQQDINNIGGMLDARQNINLDAGRDLNVVTTISNGQSEQGTVTNINRVAGIYLTGQNDGVLVASAGRDINLKGGQIGNVSQDGLTVLQAERDVNIGTISTGRIQANQLDADNYIRRSNRQDVGSNIEVQGDVYVQAKQDINVRGSEVNSQVGKLALSAGNDVNITSGESYSLIDDGSKHTGESGGGNTLVTTKKIKVKTNEAAASTLTGKQLTLQADNNVLISGSNVVAEDQLVISGKNNVTIEAAQNTRESMQYEAEKKSGLMSSGGVGFTIGKKEDTTTLTNQDLYHSGSMVGSIEGNTTIVAGKNYRQVGSDVNAIQGDVNIMAEQVDILAAQDQYQTGYVKTHKQSGLTVTVSSALIDAAGMVHDTYDSGKKVGASKNTIINTMAAANTAADSLNAYNQIQDAMKNGLQNSLQNGGINLSISYGSSKSEDQTHTEGSTAAASAVRAGGQTNIIATGAGKESNINIIGSDVSGNKGTLLSADNEVNILAAEQTHSERSKNKSSGFNAGFNVGTAGYGVTVGASKGKGFGDGDEVTYRNSHVGSNTGQTTIISGGATNIKGGQVLGKGVQVDAAELNIESLQDTATFKGKQQDMSGQITVGAGVSGSASYSQSKINADYASVHEQSGILAGDDGYQINVKGNTDLKGGLITSTQLAEEQARNQLTTGTLTSSDINNHADYSGTSMGLGVSGGFNTDLGMGEGAKQQSNRAQTDDKGHVVKDGQGNTQLATGRDSIEQSTTPGFGHDSGHDQSTTYSGINTGNIIITDEDGQKVLTGQSIQETIDNIKTDVTTDNAAANSGHIGNNFDKDKVQKELDLQREVTQAFNKNTQDAKNWIGNQQKALMDEAAELRAKDPNSQEAAELEAKAKQWQTNGLILDSISGVLSGPNSNGLLGSLANAGKPWIAAEIGDHFHGTPEENGFTQALAHAIVGGAISAATGNNALSGAIAAGGGEALGGIVKDFLYGKDTKVEDLTADQKQTISNIISLSGAGVGALVGGSGSDAVSGGQLAGNAVDNNYLALEAIDRDQADKAVIKKLLNTKDDNKVQEYVEARDKAKISGIKDSLVETYKSTEEFLKHPIDSTINTAIGLYDLAANPGKHYDQVVLSASEWNTLYANALKNNPTLAGQMDGYLDGRIGTGLTTTVVLNGAVAKVIQVGVNTSKKLLNIPSKIGGFSSQTLINGAKGLDPASKAGDLTLAGRALQKHGSREGSAFPAAKGNPHQINEQGRMIVESILSDPNKTVIQSNKGRFGKVIDIYDTHGRGVRYGSEGQFIGFLEPRS